MPAQIPSSAQASRIERRAAQIQDPIHRLRFLRREMPVARPRAFRPEWTALLMMLVLIPAPTPAGVAEISTLERRMLAPVTSVPNAPAHPPIWRVERSASSELYSNGLRIDLTFTAHNRPRAHFPIFPLTGSHAAARTGTQPVGIVYHTTESHLAPFAEDENRRLKQLGRNLLDVIRREYSYHYVIDRFGRVFRVVEEADAANHSGYSVWADADGIYVNLNDSFLGVAFEGQSGAVNQVTPAQVSAAKILTEMLRARYGIAAANCVTHAQVSVNPLNMRIGAHTDWGGSFPFAAVGLPDNYTVPLPSLYAFGFEYDAAFLNATGARWKGLDLAENQLECKAAAEGLSVVRYRADLRRRYKDLTAALKGKESGGGI